MSYAPNYNKIIGVLKDRKTKCVWFKDKRFYGMLDDDTVMINPNAGEILATICHECLHKIYPEFPEEIIVAMEIMVANNLTLKQAVEILQIFTRKAKLYEREP
jgi:hypothetical protein